jgi:hypothetical protein
MAEPRDPSLQLLIKPGSLIVHYQELTGFGAHPYDRDAIKTLENDPEVIEWIREMGKMAFLPVKRNEPKKTE